MFTDVFEGIVRRHSQPSAVRAIEAGGDHAPAWKAIQDSGVLELMAREEDGGAGLDLAGVLPILTMLGAHAVPLPVGQAIALRTLLPAGGPVPTGLPTFAPALVREEGGALLALRPPFGILADVVLGELNGELQLMDARTADRRAIGIHRDMTADLRWAAPENGCRTLRCAVPPGSLAAWGAALHAALLGGALSRSFELALQYANDRSQFGRSIGKFQAVQH